MKLLHASVLVLFAITGCGRDEAPTPVAKPAHAPLIAVASNFQEPAKKIAAAFKEKTGHDVEFTFGSTGAQFAQIKNSAPFDAWLAADSERPRLAEESGHAVAGTRFTYAIGVLALWSATAGRRLGDGKILSDPKMEHIAIAQPELAPYGLAAKETLMTLKLWDAVQRRLVFGENIGQTFQFVQSGNADIGFVAWSQVKSLDPENRRSFWVIPGNLHGPLAQDAVALTDNATAGEFLEFLRTEPAREIIFGCGYELPADADTSGTLSRTPAPTR